MTRKFWQACCLVLLIPSAFALQLIKDVNAVPTTDASGGSSFTNAVQTNGGVFFLTRDKDHGLEPWVTDGTPGGTRLLKDICAGPTSSDVEMVTAANGLAFFKANDGVNGVEIWRSDGTPDGTRLVANIGPGAADGSGGVEGYGFPAINGVIYFHATDGTTGDQLWRSDGTAAGTYRLTDQNIANGGIGPSQFQVVGTRLYFLATDSAGEELWTSDGTVAGTRRTADISPNNDGHVLPLGVVDDVLFFAANDGTHGSELWRADATGNVAVVADLTPGPGQGSGLSALGVANDRLIFTKEGGGLNWSLMSITAHAASPTVVVASLPDAVITRVTVAPGGVMVNFQSFGADLPIFMSDGTATGTGFVNSELRFYMGSLAAPVVNGWLYFYGTEGLGAPSNIYRTRGTVATTTLYATIDNPVASEYLEALNGKLYFINGRYNDAAHGSEIWSTDGTSSGTQILADLAPGPADSHADLKVIGNRLYISLLGDAGSSNPWVTDGSAANLTQLVDVGTSGDTASSDPTLLGTAGAYTLFAADDGVHGTELWSTNGTTAGTRLLYDPAGGNGIDASRGLVSMGAFALFVGNSAAGTELWRTDGTPAGTFLVKDISAGPSSSEPRLNEAVVLNGVAYFRAADNVHGMELWRSDGTDAGTRLVFDAAPGAADGLSSVIRATANGHVFVRGMGAPATLYATDGTEAGSVVVANDVNTDDTAIAFQNRVCVNVIVVNASASDYYCSDGTAGNFTRLTDFQSMGLSLTSLPYLLNGQLILTAYLPGRTGGGMYAISDLAAAPVKIGDQHFYNGVFIDGGTRFAFVDDVPGGDIVVTDGTPGNARSMLTGTSAPRSQIDYSGLFGVNDSVLFHVNDPVKGPVLWKTDGTATGTRFLFDVDPSGTSPDGPPGNFLQNGNNVYFVAFRKDTGVEPWAFSLIAPNATDDVAETPFGAAINLAVAANDSDFDSSLPAPNFEILTPPTHGTAVIASGSITYTPNAGFSGADNFVYRVFDTQGNASNAANVFVTTKADPSNTVPGTAPSPPSNPPPPSGGGSSGAQSGGGGGAFGLELLLLALPFLLRTRRVVRLR